MKNYTQFVGNKNAFRPLCKSFNEYEGWTKTVDVMEIPYSGCLIQVTTRQKNSDGSYSVAEALTFVPSVHIVEDENDVISLEANNPAEPIMDMLSQLREMVEPTPFESKD